MKEYKLREICLEITNECPMNCIHCSSFEDNRQNRIEIMDLLDIMRIIKEYSERGGKILEISGGEPLLHPHLIETIRYANKLDLETILYTSGLLSWNGIKPIDKSIAKKLKEAGLDKITFNLEGATPETHEKITRIKGSFRKLLKSIETISSMDFWIGAWFVPMKPNYKELNAVLDLCMALGINKLGVLRFVPQGRGLLNKDRLLLSKEEFVNLTVDLIKLKKSLKDIIRLGAPLFFCSIVDSSIKSSPCQAGISTCTIKTNGDVVPCPAFKQSQKYVAGNVIKNSLSEIWSDSHILTLLREFKYTKIEGRCSDCEYLKLCQGKCIAQRIISWGDLYKGEDPLCSWFKPIEKCKQLSVSAQKV